MTKFVAAIAALGLAAGTAHAADAASRVFKPKGSWTADYGDDYCRLARTFTDGSDEVSLALDRIEPGVATRMIVSGSTIKLYRGATTLGYHYLPSGDSRKTQLLHSTTADGTPFLIIYPAMLAPTPKPPAPGTPPAPPPPYDRQAEQDFAHGVQGIIVTDGTVDPIEIDTGDLKPATAALQACTDDLVKSWGVDPEKQKSATRLVFPDSDMSKWLPNGTIGFADFGKLSGGTNQIRLMVDATGKPTKCDVLYPTLDAGVNDKICKGLMANGHFKPALDAGGQAFASYEVIQPYFLMPPMKGFGR